MKSQYEKAAEFRRMHAQPGLFVTPNPWDAGTAVLLEQLGFPAQATTGAGFAFSCGLPDNHVGRERMLGHLREIVGATRLPVSADLENGFGDSPETVAETIRLAAETGVVGGSIEDSTGRPEAPLYPLSQAVERIHAAVEAARALPFPFTLTARAENFFACREPDLDDTLRRLQAYEAAGADVLFAPGLTRLSDIADVVKAVQRPINVMMGFPNPGFGLAELAEIGVRRVSIGGSLARAAFGAFLQAATEIRERGTFGYGEAAIPNREINQRFVGRREAG
jgi:2-methylisocitrate lyase-like PEP mutase family enzyme